MKKYTLFSIVLVLALAAVFVLAQTPASASGPVAAPAAQAGEGEGCLTCHEGIESIREEGSGMQAEIDAKGECTACHGCLLYTSPSPRDKRQSRMPSSA